MNGDHVYKVILACEGVPASDGEEAAADITKEFADHRQWHQNVKCSWDGQELVLEAENDFDDDGLALLDEFSDCIAAYVPAFDGRLRIVSVSKSE